MKNQITTLSFSGLKLTNRCVIIILSEVLLTCSSISSKAQSNSSPVPADTTNKWHYIVEPYLMFPNMHGTVGLGNLPDAAIDERPGDIFSNLRMGAMLYGEAHNAHWAISSDLTYMKLGSDVAGKKDILSGDATAKQLAWEVAVLRKFNPWLEAGLALQLNSIKADMDLILNTTPPSTL